MPCLIELGEKSKEIHKKIGEKIAEVCGLAIIVTKDRFKEIKEKAGDKAIFLENPKEILEKIKDFSGKDDVILLEGRIPKETRQFLITKINSTFFAIAKNRELLRKRKIKER
jgi:UDP-N-acetylmuramyl pentapeptide synthase